jgi:dihydroorotase-like cyclic amidohydrolase
VQVPGPFTVLCGLRQAEATARAIRLAKFIGVPLYVVHVMAAEALEEVGLASPSMLHM